MNHQGVKLGKATEQFVRALAQSLGQAPEATLALILAPGSDQGEHTYLETTKGVAHLGELLSIDLSGKLGKLAQLPDLSGLAGFLRNLVVSGNQLKALRLPELPELYFLKAGDNPRLAELDLAGCALLEKLDLKGTPALARIACTDYQQQTLPALSKHPGAKARPATAAELDFIARESNGLFWEKWNKPRVAALIRHPACDRGTLLRAYYELGALGLRRYKDAKAAPADERANFALAQEIAQRVRAGQYATSAIAYAPPEAPRDAKARWEVPPWMRVPTPRPLTEADLAEPPPLGKRSFAAPAGVPNLLLPPKRALEFFQWMAMEKDLELESWRPPEGEAQAQRWLGELPERYTRLAIAALDLGQGPEVAAGWLAQVARACVALGPAVEESDLPKALFALSVAGDVAATRAFALAWQAAHRGPGYKPAGKFERAYGALADVLLAHHLGDAAGLASAVKAAASQKSAWTWGAPMLALAAHCAGAPQPSPEKLLEEAAQAGVRTWRDLLGWDYDSVFNDRALAFAALAQDRGWKPPTQRPHPSVVLELLRVPAPGLRKRGPWAAPDAALLERIRARLKG